jgi:hypothetical protein
MLTCVSLTGPDDRTDMRALAELGARFSFVEWALLYVPHNEGAPRNPTRAWREAFFDSAAPGSRAVHLCGSLAFEELLAARLPAEVLRANRLQLNVNARRRDFSDEQVLDIYRRALDLGPDIILQRHADTAVLADRFVAGLPAADKPRVHVLLDDSRGGGKAPDTWQRPSTLDGVECGYAGGIGPQNVVTVLESVNGDTHPYWIDMESGVRTDNEFDLAKAQAVLRAASDWIAF